MADERDRTTLTVKAETGRLFRELRYERRETTDGLLRELLDEAEATG